VEKPALGFIALKSLKQGAPDADAALAEIRRIYFNTTRQTIDHDLAHAIELLKSLPTEQAREKATVFMQGLSEMQREWQAETKKKRKRSRGQSGGSGTSGRSGRSRSDGSSTADRSERSTTDDGEE
jgi:hypothetical protein